MELSTLRALEDPHDLNGDGISGRLNEVWDVQEGALARGRFGLKANSPNLLQQSAEACFNDMGPGLADGRPDGVADGQEWRTAPLWGLGLTRTVLPYSSHLHDGRARTFEEAILWHGGEAERSRERYRSLSATEREALLKFLSSL